MPDDEEGTLDDFLTEAGIEPEVEEEETEEEPQEKPLRGPRRTDRSLVGGEVEEAKLKPETVKHEVVRFMKVHTITRTPDLRIADFDLTNSAGKLYSVTIDEATARAIAALFD